MSKAIKYCEGRPYTPAQWAEVQEVVGVTADGMPGSRTVTAIKRWQARQPKRMKIAADGMAGRKSIAAMGLSVPAFFGVEGFMARHPGRDFLVDASFYQGLIDWALVAEAGVTGAYLRASQWDRYRDGKFKSNRSGCRREGLPWGAYHVGQMLREGRWSTPEQEVTLLMRQLGDDAGSLPVALDLEQKILRAVREHRTASWVSSWCVEFMSLVSEQGLVSRLYLSRHAQKMMERREVLVAASDWLVDYMAIDTLWEGEPRLADGWEASPWTLRQVSEEGHCPGIRGAVDLNIARRGWTP